MALRTPPKRDSFLTRNHSLTPPTAALLRKYSIEATDSLGGAVSNSTVIRALLRYAELQDPTWLQDHLFPLIEKEMVGGTPPQRKKRGGP
jgi:hypothetical protein